MPRPERERATLAFTLAQPSCNHDHRQPNRQKRLAPTEVIASTAPVKISDTTLDDINDLIAEILREEAEREARADREPDTAKDNSVRVRALGMLAEASRWFNHKGWKTLPDSRRGWLIVQWGAEVAWQGNPTNPERGARAWCCKWQPLLRLKQNKAKLDRIIAEAARTKTLWAPDIGGATLEITVSDLVALGFRFLGACDDQNYDARNEIRKAKNAACQRRRRAANSSGRKKGRPALSPEERLARGNARATKARRKAGAVSREEYLSQSKSRTEPWKAEGISRSTWERRRKAGGTEIDASASRKIASPHIESITAVTHLSVTDFRCHDAAALNLDRFDFSAFGIVAITVMRGTDIVRSWVTP